MTWERTIDLGGATALAALAAYWTFGGPINRITAVILIALFALDLGTTDHD